jgi:hypothetical protein
MLFSLIGQGNYLRTIFLILYIYYLTLFVHILTAMQGRSCGGARCVAGPDRRAEWAAK